MSYLHSQRVIHGDLKGVRLSDSFSWYCPSLTQLQVNVLIDKQRRGCLADFGLTRITAEFTSSGTGEPKCTPGWTSPEVMWPDKYGAKDGRPTKESDVYSLGILIYEVRMLPAIRPQDLRQGPNRSSAGIGLSRRCKLGSQRKKYCERNSRSGPRLGSQILSGALWKAVGRLSLRSVRPLMLC